MVLLPPAPQDDAYRASDRTQDTDSKHNAMGPSIWPSRSSDRGGRQAGRDRTRSEGVGQDDAQPCIVRQCLHCGHVRVMSGCRYGRRRRTCRCIGGCKRKACLVPLDSLRSLGTPFDSTSRVACHEQATGFWASRMVRKRGFEPRWYCYRQPLKLVRLPVPPLPRGRACRRVVPSILPALVWVPLAPLPLVS